MRYITTTKNLFDVNTTPTFNKTGATYVVEGTKVTFKSNNTTNTSFFYSIPTTVGKTYTVSVNSIDWDSTSIGIFLSSAKSVDKFDYGQINKTVLTQTFVAVSDTLWIHGYLSYLAGDFTFTFDKLQVELGDTATPYVPYGYLPMYKGRYKVSDVCQLLDKSKYPATQTNAGVTVTNNGDGTITANGNCTYTLNIAITEIDKFTIKAKHKYLILDSSGSTSRNQYSTWVRSGRGSILLDSVSTPIGSIGYNDNKCTVFIRFNNGVSVSNITFKPQLFDLTEMFGAGNEPTTVAEFKEKFPDELYPYSPYCWAKIKSLIYKDDINYLKMK